MIKNRSELLSHGFIKGREKALDIAEHALQHVDPRAAVKRYVTLDGNKLRVKEDVFDLNPRRPNNRWVYCHKKGAAKSFLRHAWNFIENTCRRISPPRAG